MAAILVDGHAPFWPSAAGRGSVTARGPERRPRRPPQDAAALERGARGHRPHGAGVHREPLRAGALRGDPQGGGRHPGRGRRADGEDPDDAGGLVQEWMDTVGKGVPGYVTPKVAVGAAVGNDKGELLLIQRADSGIWLYPTGWCDVGYSAAEVVVKEVEEETGIIAEPVRLIAVLDGLRLGFTRVPLYSLLFYCRAVGGELAPHPLETRDVGWFTRDTLPQPLVGSERWGDHVFAALNGEQRDVLYDSVRQPMWRGDSAHVVISVGAAASADDDLCAAVTALVPQLSRPRPRPTPAQPGARSSPTRPPRSSWRATDDAHRRAC